MGKLLDSTSQPGDLKKLDTRQLKQLAGEIRQELVSTVFQTGGHLASNLGVVELTIALHATFDSPRDKIIWDVGHQSYVHKILTGRRDRFSTIRQYSGLSGFPAREESEHDPFGTGHSSTSVSAALGIAKARDLAGEDYSVVAVIGDGAMTGGLAFEGLNHAGHLGTKLIVVLNDNGMSIARNVGAMALYLSRLRTDPRYTQAKAGVESALTRLPLGNWFLNLLKRFKQSFKGFVIPTMIWEELGFTYLGPIDGHDIEALREALELARTVPKPVMVHVCTTKGKGYDPAEVDAVSFHGVSPNGVKGGTAPSYSHVFGETLVRIARSNPRIVAITAAMPDGTGLVPFSKEFPTRFYDVGIAEQHAVTFAAGLAANGYRPVVAIYSTFLQRAYDQIVHDVCVQNLPVIFAIDRGGLVGDDGRTHQGSFDVSYLRHIPNMIVMSPKDENELRHMLWTATELNEPVAIRYPRGSGAGVPLDKELVALPVGKAEVLREGNDLAIVAYGPLVQTALAAADTLAQNGLEATVVNARFAKPLDEELMVDLAERLPLLITLEENALLGGFGSAVLEALEPHRPLRARIRCLGLPDEFIEHGAPQILRRKHGLSIQGIMETVAAELPGKQRPVVPEDQASART